MNDSRFAPVCLAALLLGQMVIGPIANFTLVGDVFDGPGGFLANGARHATALGLAALLSIALAALSAGIALVLWPVLRPLSERMALTLAMLGAAVIALAGFENVGLLSMLSLSQAYSSAAAADEVLYQALRRVVASNRNWAHLVQLLASGAVLLAVYASLFRFRLVPRWLAGLGMLAAVSQMIAVTRPLFGGWVIFPMLAPIGLANLLLAGWLLWKRGFERARDAPR